MRKSGWRLLESLYAATCRECQVQLPSDSHIWWQKESKAVRCLDCPPLEVKRLIATKMPKANRAKHKQGPPGKWARGTSKSFAVCHICDRMTEAGESIWWHTYIGAIFCLSCCSDDPTGAAMADAIPAYGRKRLNSAGKANWMIDQYL